MTQLRQAMFERLLPNLEQKGIFAPRICEH